MPARAVFSLVLIAIVAGGATIFAAQALGISLALIGLAGVGMALALRVWMNRR